MSRRRRSAPASGRRAVRPAVVEVGGRRTRASCSGIAAVTSPTARVRTGAFAAIVLFIAAFGAVAAIVWIATR